jgi:hydroxypyruvate isomerase
MGIKQFFGRSLLSLIQDTQQPTEAIRSTNRLHDMFQNNMAAMVAFKIDNGFVVRTMNPEDAYSGGRMPGFVYCADHQAIADHLVSSAMKDRLGVQQDMFAEQRKQVNVVRKSQAAGLVGTQQANPSY